MQSVIIVLVVVLVLEIESVKTASRTTTSTNRMTNKIGVPQPIFSLKKFLFPIRLAAFQARGQRRRSYVNKEWILFK